MKHLNCPMGKTAHPLVPSNYMYTSSSSSLCRFRGSNHGEQLQRQTLVPITSALFRPSPSLRGSCINLHSLPDLIQSVQKSPLKLSERWREIQGEKHWERLLDHPIDATLRSEIIRYGEFAQVCYDAFDFNEHSLYCGSCKYSKGALFEKVDKGQCGYEVTKYLYATSKPDLPKFFRKSEREMEKRWSRDSNWIGYIAVCADEAEIRRIGRRDILIAWRGTVTKTEWAEDLKATQAPANIEYSRPSYNGRYKPAVAAELRVSDNDGRSNSAPVQAPRGTAQSTARTDSDMNDEIVKVESGFLSLYSSSKADSRFNKLSAGQQMVVEVKRLLQKYAGEELSISVTGHSLGAALALLCAYDIAANVAPSPNPLETPSSAPGSVAGNPITPPITSTEAGPAVPPNTTAAASAGGRLITVFSFGGPRVGNRTFKRRMEQLGVRVLRIVNMHDCVPKVPGVIFNERWSADANIKVLSGYHHLGKELLIDFDYSPHLRRTRDLPSHHNLEAHLHVLDGFHGFNNPFQTVLGRSHILVNKSSDFLIKEAHIPPSWWQESNKGLVKDPSSGQWVLASREDDHLPEPHH